MRDDHHHQHDHHDRDDARFDEQTNTRPSGGNVIGDEASDDGVDRRGFLRCMAWAGTAAVWGMAGGVPTSFSLSRLASLTESQRKSIFFAQISDSHIGFASCVMSPVCSTSAGR